MIRMESAQWQRLEKAQNGNSIEATNHNFGCFSKRRLFIHHNSQSPSVFFTETTRSWKFFFSPDLLISIFSIVISWNDRHFLHPRVFAYERWVCFSVGMVVGTRRICGGARRYASAGVLSIPVWISEKNGNSIYIYITSIPSIAKCRWTHFIMGKCHRTQIAFVWPGSAVRTKMNG